MCIRDRTTGQGGDFVKLVLGSEPPYSGRWAGAGAGAGVACPASSELVGLPVTPSPQMVAVLGLLRSAAARADKKVMVSRRIPE